MNNIEIYNKLNTYIQYRITNIIKRRICFRNVLCEFNDYIRAHRFLIGLYNKHNKFISKLLFSKFYFRRLRAKNNI